MLSHSIDTKTQSVVELKVSHVDSIVQTSLGIVDSKYKCTKCSACFNTRSHLRTHLTQVHKNHRDNTNSDTNNLQHRWKCSYCAARFRTRDLKNVHQKECRQLNNSRNELTDIKESEFVDYNDFDTSEFHSGSEANNGDDSSSSQKEFKFESKCGPFDDENGDNMSEIRDPSFIKRKENNAVTGEKWKCKRCSKCFETIQLLNLHQSKEHIEPENKFFSDVNIKQEQFDFEDLQLKTEHERQDYDTTLSTTQQDSKFRWKCITCSIVFETRELLRIHRRSHTGIRKIAQTVRTGWNCNICDAIFTSRDKVRLHKEVNHPKEKRERRCNDVTKNWGDVGQYECELCDKKFISKSKIRKHMDVHKNKDRPKRLCTICGLELCSTYNLNNHIRTVHGRERKFHCTFPLCDRRFSHSHHLKTHMNRHKGIRPFQCEQCVKSFFDKTTLREHIKSVHLNLKAYACRICSRTFNRSGNMRAHMLKTHNLGNLTSTQCAENNRSSGVGSSNNEPPGYDSDDFSHRFYPNNLGEPFRSLMKLSN